MLLLKHEEMTASVSAQTDFAAMTPYRSMPLHCVSAKLHACTAMQMDQQLASHGGTVSGETETVG